MLEGIDCATSPQPVQEWSLPRIVLQLFLLEGVAVALAMLSYRWIFGSTYDYEIAVFVWYRKHIVTLTLSRRVGIMNITKAGGAGGNRSRTIPHTNRGTQQESHDFR